MTKKVRIENADTSNHNVSVEVWQSGKDGEPDKLASTVELNHPTALTEQLIYQGQYLKIIEAPKAAE